MSSLLVVAGEASGDRAAASVIAATGTRDAFGMGGIELESKGVDLVADLRDATAMGLGGVAARAGNIARAFLRLRRAVGQRRPRAALLVNYTDFNLRMAGFLRDLRVPVFWYVAPQVWAWRPKRGKVLAKLVKKLFVILPFEERLFRDLGVDAEYVGHPCLEGLDSEGTAGVERRGVAILPGSRPHEVRRLLPLFLNAASRLAPHHRQASRVILPSSLDQATLNHATRASASSGITTLTSREPLVVTLRAFRASLVASGTASLEAALAGANPVVAYRVDAITALIARRLLLTEHVALPNVLLERRAYPELLQEDANPSRIDAELERAIRSPEGPTSELRAVFGPPKSPSKIIAAALAPYLLGDVHAA